MEPSAGVAKGRLDIGRCFNDAFEIYKKNIPLLVVATLLFQVLSLFSLFILTGPLMGGYVIMLTNSLRREGGKVLLGEMFQAFNRFGPFLGLFLVQTIILILGFILLIIPGLLLATMWLFSFFILVDKNKGVFDSLSASWNIVRIKGIGINLLILIIHIILTAVTANIPFIGWLANLLITPFGFLLLASAYKQQVLEDEGELKDILRQGMV